MFSSKVDAVFFECEIPVSQSQLISDGIHLPVSLQQAAQGRQNEFLAGRWCAFKAAQILGLNLNNLEIGENREPKWPEGIIGSISHSKELAVAVVALNKSQTLKLGLDTELIINESRFETIEKIVIDKTEIELIKSLTNEQWSKNILYTLVFSAKEALYKALYPYCQCFIEFQEAKLVGIDINKKCLVLELRSQKTELKNYNQNYFINFAFNKNHIICYLEHQ
jgi:enterobactin synthetase component D